MGRGAGLGRGWRRAVVGGGRRREYLCWPPPSSSPARASQRKKTQLKVRNESIRGYEPIPALIWRLGGLNHGIPSEGIRTVGMEFGPNSRPNFMATPNAGIRVWIPEFWIPGSILSNQTGWEFEGIGGDYSISWDFFDRLFTRSGLERIILGYPQKSPSH
jgi:hypothetical protein